MMRNDAIKKHHFAIDCEGDFKNPPDFLSINEGFFSKISPSLFTIKEFFSKTHQSSLTLKGGSTSHLGLLPSGEKRKPPYSVLKPLRYMVGGPSEVFASSGAAVCGMRPHGHESLRGCLVLAVHLEFLQQGNSNNKAVV